jgi:hypothetical protein
MKLFSFFKKHKKENVTLGVTADSESSKKKLERDSMTDILVATWNTLNVDLLASYLAKDFQYNSVWVSNTIKGKEQYLTYLRGKFDALKKSGDVPIADVIDESGYLRPRIRQQGLGVELVLDVVEEDGKITRILMRPIVKVSILDEKEWASFAGAYNGTLPMCYQTGGKSIQKFISSKGLTHPDFAWLQSNLVRPSFQHLCFRYLSDVYSIIIAVHGFSSGGGKDDDRIIVSKQDYENLVRESKKNNLVPCFLPIAARPQLPMINGIHLIHAITGEIIQLGSRVNELRIPMSEWEINNMGIQTVTQYLIKENCKINSYCDVVGIEPQIWFEKEGKTSYVIVRSIPIGKRKEKFRINKNLLLKLVDYDGYFADVQFESSSPILKDGDGNIVPLGKRDGDDDIWMWRGDGFYCNFNGLQKIEKAIVENNFIEVYEADSYDIR